MAGLPFNASLLSPHLKTAFNFLHLSEPRTPNPERTLFIDRSIRALADYPSAWTNIPTTKGNKRMKIISGHQSPVTGYLLLDLIQLEGYKPSHFNQLKSLLQLTA
jgi:hypothetical protein